MNFILLLLAAVALFCKWIYTHFRVRYRFWKEHNVPHLEPRFPVGNAGDIMKSTIHFAHIMDNLYRELKHFGDYAGIYFFRDPVLVVLSPEFAKTVLVKDFNYFLDRGVYSNEKDDPLSANLFFMEGHRWRKLRAKLTPTFTTGKLKAMFHTILAVGEQFDRYLQDYTMQKDEVEVKDLLARFTTDIIGSCAFGIDCNSLENPESKFRQMGKRMINFPKLKALKIFFAMLFRKQARWLGIRFNDEDVSDFFFEVVRDTIRYREENNVERKDFMQLLIELKNKGYMEDDGEVVEELQGSRLEKLTFEEIAAQAFVFFFAGFETSATTMTFALHLLASNQEVQDKGRKCVTDVLDRHDGKLTYEALMEMTYIDCIIQETLRIYPPVATIHRITTKPYKLPNGSVLPEGVGVVIPSLAFQRDAEFFPEPMEFRPERFFEEEKDKRHNFCHLPFGEGPRICIGMRFGLLQTRMGIAMLLKNYRFQLCSKSVVPLKTDPVNLIYGPAGDVWLGIEKIQ
ncbi:probable cytochrome P450 6a20 [Aedes albopictus]|uniref:Cytochrome P450 n=1 Tax=Aedes albopictus TaxID=7160 RepID=A0ABM1YQ70_AEDAL|nr:probable cytochrome P450 6a20 [Aedes albopictus]